MDTPAAPRLAFTVAEAAERVGVSARTVYRLVETGELAGRRIGTRIVIPARVLHEYVDPPLPAEPIPADLPACEIAERLDALPPETPDESRSVTVERASLRLAAALAERREVAS